MLFDISTGKPIKVPSWAQEQLKKDFPNFYKGKSVKIKCVEERKLKKMLVRAGDTEGDDRRIKIEAPAGNSRKAKGYVTDPNTGEVIHIQYSTAQPNVDRTGMLKFKYPSAVVELRDGMSINSKQEDLLFYVHYLCPHIGGNRCEKPAVNPFYVYDDPAAEAQQKLSRSADARKLENLIYHEVSDEVVLTAIKNLGLKDQGNPAQNRVYLLDKMTKGATETFYSNAMNTIKTLTSNKKKESSEDYSDLVTKLVDMGVIKFDSGSWYEIDGRGDGTKFKTKPFFEGKGDASEARFALLDHLKTNEKLVEQLKNHLK